jgi:uncharacterized protein (TIGR02001 family)
MKYTSTAALLTVLLGSSVAQADVSGNFGWNSEYIYRGIPQKDSSAYLGLDFSQSGFYLGTWAADVGDGAEVDLYAGFEGQAGEITYGIGGTGYFYTGDFDDTYTELNLNLGYSGISLSGNVGSYENFDGPTQDYTFFSAGYQYGPLYFVLGSFGNDFDGEYYEAGYGTDLAGFDVGVSIVHSTSDLVGKNDTSIFFSIGKSVDIRRLLTTSD